MGPLGYQEAIFIFVLALLVFGPKKLPELGKTVGKAMTEFRRASNELKSTWNREMEAIGYETKGEFGIPGRRYFRKGGEDRTHHVHAFARGDINVKKLIAFRDYLRSNHRVAREYELLKKSIALTCGNDIVRYCDGKDAYIKRIEAIAMKEVALRQPDADKDR